MEAWLDLTFDPSIEQVPSCGGYSLRLREGGAINVNIAERYGWDPKAARAWVRDLIEFDLICPNVVAHLMRGIRQNRRLSRDSVPKVTMASVVAKTSGKCVYCACTLTMEPSYPNSVHIDHVLPVTRGGSDDIANLVPSCRTCNLSKGAKTILEFTSNALSLRGKHFP